MSPETVQRPTAEQIRNRVHQMWGSVAESWGEHVDHVEQRAEAVTRLMIDAVAPVPGDEVLELACGAGGLGLAIADRVTPGGRVVLSDVAPEMVAIASARAAGRDQVDRVRHPGQRAGPRPGADRPARRLIRHRRLPRGTHVRTRPASGPPPRSPESCGQVAERPSRCGVPRDRNPWLGVLADAVHQHTGTPVPPPGTPGPFSLGADGALETTLTAAGLEQVSVQPVDVPTDDASFDDYWQLRTDLAGPLKKRLAALPAEDLTAIKETVRERLSRYQTSEGLRIPGLAYVGSARRSAAPQRRKPTD